LAALNRILWKTLLGRPRRRWDDNTGMDVREVGWEIVGWAIWFRIGTSGGLL